MAFSSSFVDSDLIWNVVMLVFWLPEASSLTLNLLMTCFITSPKDTGLPSLLVAAAVSLLGSVKESVTRGCLLTAGLIRGPLPQAVLGATFPEVGARDGKADWDSVSSACVVEPLRALTGVESAKEGKGSGAPSSSCLFYKKWLDVWWGSEKHRHQLAWRSAAERAMTIDRTSSLDGDDLCGEG